LQALYEDLYIGQSFKPTSYIISRDLIKNYVDIMKGIFGIEYKLPGNGEDIYFPLLPAIYQPLKESLGDVWPGEKGIHIRQSFNFNRVARVGEKLTIYPEIASKHTKGYSQFITFKVKVVGQLNDLVQDYEIELIYNYIRS
jgi:hypothetical protein